MATFSGDDLTCIRGQRIVFEALSFELQSGEALVLIGPNGSGKSSLLRMMAGFCHPVVGRLLWNGADMTRDRDEHSEKFQYVGHQNALKLSLSVRENICFWKRIRNDAGAQSDAEALQVLGLERLADTPVRYLSAGQRRRLALARLMVVNAPLWLLDEPRNALDAQSIRRLDAVIDKHREAGGIAVMALHDGDYPKSAKYLDLNNFQPRVDVLASAC
jgi:heme exporter protein A